MKQLFNDLRYPRRCAVQFLSYTKKKTTENTIIGE